MRPSILVAIAAMVSIVALSNVLVQYPVFFTLGQFNLADILTWGAFTYPIAFLVTDLSNRTFGPAQARLVVLVGFAVAITLSVILATPRIAMASGTAFLLAQLLDVTLFNRLRTGAWWKAPVISSGIASVIDTTLFFSMAFAAEFAFFGANDVFAIEPAQLVLLGIEAPRWMSWALGDLGVKLLAVVILLLPYRALTAFIKPLDGPPNRLPA